MRNCVDASATSMMVPDCSPALTALGSIDEAGKIVTTTTVPIMMMARHALLPAADSLSILHGRHVVANVFPCGYYIFVGASGFSMLGAGRVVS